MKRTFAVFSFFAVYISLLGYFLAQLGAPVAWSWRVTTPRALPSYSAFPSVLSPFAEGEIIYGDARSEIVNKYLSRYGSPFAGLGDYIVTAADKYKIHFGLVPAIAQCESNVGKKIPEGSFNAWGYGIYGEKVTKFASWEEAIDTVSRGLRKNYYSKGLDTPEKIMKFYTPNSDGSWANCVNKYLAELK
jgi:hypothetical protein